MTSVGVSQLTPRQFLEDLATLIATDAESFRKKDSKWQIQLATTLVKLSTDPELMPLIRNLAIVPLNDGTWIAAQDNTIFYAKSDASIAIPDGIRILIVDSNAESGSIRRTLFTSIGVKEWAAPEVCRLILSVHASADFQPERTNTTQLVSHAIFLYKAKWQLPKGADLWFATTGNKRFRGREVYIPGSVSADSAAARIFAVLEKHFPVLREDYLTALPGEPEFIEWLVQNLGLSKIPRLVTPMVEPRPQPMETPPLLDSLSDNEVNPSSGDTQARKVDTTLTDSEGDGLFGDLPDSLFRDLPLIDPTDHVSRDKHSPLDEPQVQKDFTEPFPSFDEPMVPKISREPTPSLAKLAEQDISGDIIYWSERPVILRSRLADPSERTIEWACDPCQKTLGIWKCDGKQPICGPCVSRHISCHYSPSRRGRVKSHVLDSHGRWQGARDPSNDLPAPLSSPVASLNMNKDVGLSEQMAAQSARRKNPLSEQAEHIYEPKELLFDLSDELDCLLDECELSDVFQLIRDNWHHYSQWVEGAHLKWQTKEYVFASTHLKNKIGATLVQTSRGSLPINETVLARLDSQLDQSKVVPALRLHQPEDPDWNLLAHFGVGVKRDVHYYLQCMNSLSRDENPDIDVVGYIYEEIQSRYTGNEGIIR